MHALSRWGARRAGPALLDGEIVALDAEGQPSGFQRIQDRIHLTEAREIVARAAANPIAFVAFDLLRDGDEDLCALPLVERRRRLEAALAPALGDVDPAVDAGARRRRGAAGGGARARLGRAGRQGRAVRRTGPGGARTASGAS